MPRRSSKRSSSNRAGSSVAAEVQRLFKAGDQVDTALLVQLRNKYGDEEVADRVREAFVQRHSMVVRGAKKFAQAIRTKYAQSNIPYHQLLMKAQLHARKHGLSQAEFAEFQRMYEQELAGTSRANEVVLPLTTMIKVLGNLSGDGRSSGVSISENDYRNLQEILKLHEASKPLHSQVVVQNLGYNDITFQNVVANGKLSKARHNPGEHVHPVVAALFGPSIPVVQNHFLYSNLSGIIKSLYNREPLRTRPDYELYYNLITDPNDVVCDNRTPVGDLLQRCNLQNQLWNAVLHLRNGQHYNSSFREFMTAVDVCRLNKHDSPDLVYGRHDGTVFKRLINAFSFRPTVVATIPVHTVFANNPYAQNVRPTITNIPMINVRLVSFQSVTPVSIQGGNLTGGQKAGDVHLNDAVNQVQTFIEGNMLVNRVTNVISSRQVLFFYVDRRAHIMNVGMRHFNLNNLPKSVAGLERTNEQEVTVPATLHVGTGASKDNGAWQGGTKYHLRSAVCVKTTPYTNVVGTSGMATEGLSNVALVTGSTAVVMDNKTVNTTDDTKSLAKEISAAALTEDQWLYDPVDAINSSGDTAACWNKTKVNDKLERHATILVYQSNESDERLGLVAI
jgi:hypothetical protein